MAEVVSEKEAQRTVVNLATLFGWLSYHTFDSRRSAGGFPDLVMVRGDRVVYVEMKKVGEEPREDQVKWLDALAAAGCEVYVWTIDDVSESMRVLQSRERPSECSSAWEPTAGGADARRQRDNSGQVRSGS